ncbi:MAG: type IV secretory system conjugative DNA transfer family protein, partial [Clostridia bacterium]|nr:type IV secretory system conjugative DNA transfer family protein [Clostridia bacterium]
MNLSIKNIEKLLIEANEKSHENSKCIDCKKDSNVYGGRWIKQSEIPSLDEIGQPVYMDEERVLLYPLSHNLIIGSTGSGKTTVLYDNCIDFYSKMKEEKRPSFLVLDLKGDMYTRHTKKLEEAGYKVRVIDMRNAFFSARYNPLATIFDYYSECCQIEKAIKNQSIGDTYKGVKYDSVVQANSIALARYFELNDAIARSVNELAEIIVVNTDAKNLNWTEGGRSCLKAILYTMLRDYENKKFGMTKEKFTLSNVIKTSFTTENDYIPLINWLRRADDIPIVAGALGSCYDIRAQVTRDGYTSSLNTELNKYSLTSVSVLTSQSDILISEIAECKEDYAIFLITDSRAQITNNIAMMFINDLINTLSESADKKPARCLDKDFIILADEMGNLPQIPNMSGKISTLRSRKIWLQMSVQSLEQLDQTYGDKVAAT